MSVLTPVRRNQIQKETDEGPCTLSKALLHTSRRFVQQSQDPPPRTLHEHHQFGSDSPDVIIQPNFRATGTRAPRLRFLQNQVWVKQRCWNTTFTQIHGWHRTAPLVGALERHDLENLASIVGDDTEKIQSKVTGQKSLGLHS